MAMATSRRARPTSPHSHWCRRRASRRVRAVSLRSVWVGWGVSRAALRRRARTAGRPPLCRIPHPRRVSQAPSPPPHRSSHAHRRRRAPNCHRATQQRPLPPPPGGACPSSHRSSPRRGLAAARLHPSPQQTHHSAGRSCRPLRSSRRPTRRDRHREGGRAAAVPTTQRARCTPPRPPCHGKALLAAHGSTCRTCRRPPAGRRQVMRAAPPALHQEPCGRQVLEWCGGGRCGLDRRPVRPLTTCWRAMRGPCSRHAALCPRARCPSRRRRTPRPSRLRCRLRRRSLSGATLRVM
mmetsp:Transcript_35301/g.87686  ORF Transcript_35301/g.87686 Transcript_35301/m.87686 type:complete len:294 (+) Transcript_35301:3100-3981(+)